jgi:hypothetical protein
MSIFIRLYSLLAVWLLWRNTVSVVQYLALTVFCVLYARLHYRASLSVYTDLSVDILSLGGGAPALKGPATPGQWRRRVASEGLW